MRYLNHKKYIDPELFKDISSIYANGNYIIGIGKSGNVVMQGCGSYYEKYYPIVSEWKDVKKIVAGPFNIIGLFSDGTVASADKNYKTEHWEDVIDIYGGPMYVLGIKKDGTVYSDDTNYFANLLNRNYISDWKDIISIACGKYHIIGLKKDGTVVANGQNIDGQCNVSKWSNVYKIWADGSYSIGMKDNGEFVFVGDIKKGLRFAFCNRLGQFSDIDQIATSQHTIVGLKNDGTVVATGLNDRGQCDKIIYWSNIKKVLADYNRFYGLKEDGKIVCTLIDDYNKQILSWRDIIDIVLTEDFIAGLKKDGTVVTTRDETSISKAFKSLLLSINDDENDDENDNENYDEDDNENDNENYDEDDDEDDNAVDDEYYDKYYNEEEYYEELNKKIHKLRESGGWIRYSCTCRLAEAREIELIVHYDFEEAKAKEGFLYSGFLSYGHKELTQNYLRIDRLIKEIMNMKSDFTSGQSFLDGYDEADYIYISKWYDLMEKVKRDALLETRLIKGYNIIEYN